MPGRSSRNGKMVTTTSDNTALLMSNSPFRGRIFSKSDITVKGASSIRLLLSFISIILTLIFNIRRNLIHHINYQH